MDKKELLRIFSYGSDLRDAIEKIVKARGALVVFVNSKEILEACVGGFKLDENFSKEKLAELAKLDGAILVDSSLDKILYSNVLLSPNTKISSSETGTRHQAAERTASQFNTLVLAISEKSKTATIYYGGGKMKLNSLNELFTKTGETLKSLEKNERSFEKLIKKLDISEALDLVRIEDIVLLFQRKKIIDLVAETLSIYLAELGKEGEIVGLQFAEIVNFVNTEAELIKKDYGECIDFEAVEAELSKMRYDEILNKKSVLRVFTENMKDELLLVPKGHRILRNIPILDEEDIVQLTSKFLNLREMMSASEQDFSSRGIGEKKSRTVKEYLLRVQV